MEGQTLNNGRVSDATKVSNYRKSEEEIIYNNQKDDALKGILERTKLSNAFFHRGNIYSILNKHDLAIKTIKKLSKRIILV